MSHSAPLVAPTARQGCILNTRTILIDRNDHIAALRGAAIVCVLLLLLLHFALAYGLKNSPLEVLPDWLLNAAYQGNYGVTMFFVISGYLITSTSLRRWGELARIDLAAFICTASPACCPRCCWP